MHKHALENHFDGYQLFTVPFVMLDGKKFQAKPERLQGFRYVGDYQILNWADRVKEYEDQIAQAKAEPAEDDGWPHRATTFKAWLEEHKKDDQNSIYIRKTKDRLNMVKKLNAHDIVFDKAGNQVWPKPASKFQKTSVPKI